MVNQQKYFKFNPDDANVQVNYLDNPVYGHYFDISIQVPDNRDEKLSESICRDLQDENVFLCSSCGQLWHGDNVNDFCYCPKCGARITPEQGED